MGMKFMGFDHNPNHVIKHLNNWARELKQDSDNNRHFLMEPFYSQEKKDYIKSYNRAAETLTRHPKSFKKFYDETEGDYCNLTGETPSLQHIKDYLKEIEHKTQKRRQENSKEQEYDYNRQSPRRR